jgi:hypothetical protein
MNPRDQPTRPTEAQYKLAHIIRQSSTQERAAQLISDSEARAVAQLRSELNYAKASETLYHDEGTAAIAELAAAKAECERLTALSSWAHTCVHHTDAERAGSACPCCATAELARLRAEVERWKTVAAEMAQQREHNANERDRADAEVAAFKKLLLEFGQLTEGVINGGDCREKILYIHVPCDPRGHMVGQPVKVILPAIDAAMKGTPTL